jgi:putative ABC transport system substrate-binding protein
LAALAPDVILAHGVSGVSAMLQATRSVPIVFPVVGDPVAAGYVESLARPGGNVTGFMTFEYSTGGKWLELLKEIAPSVARVAVLRDPTLSTGIGHLSVPPRKPRGGRRYTEPAWPPPARRTTELRGGPG